MPYLSGVSAIAAGSVHSLALKIDGKVGVWGDNTYGQLGDGTTSDRHAPIVLNTLGNVKAIAAGGGIAWRWSRIQSSYNSDPQ